MAESAAFLPEVLASATASSSGWEVQSVVSTVTDVTVTAVGLRGCPPGAMLKLPRTSVGVASQRSHLSTLAALNADERLGDWRRLLPQVIGTGELEGQAFLLERAVPGEPSSVLLSQAQPPPWVLPAVVEAIAPLHQQTSSTVAADSWALQRWVEGPLAQLELVRMSLPDAARRTALDRVRAMTGDLLAGQRLTVSWVHGDYTPSNIFLDPVERQVTAVLDWDRARPDHLAVVDILHLLVAIRARRERCEIGDVVQRLLGGERWTGIERRVLIDCVGGGDLALEAPMVLLCWLLHVDNNLDKSLSFASHRYWIRHNIEAVLSCLS
jgi:aminoglycoside phosphotransferase